MFLGLRTVIYPAPDLEASKAWFTALLGVQPYFDQPFYVGFNVGGYELGLLPDAVVEDGPVTYWGVQDAEAVWAALLANGASPRTPVQDVGDGIRTACVREPAGSLVGIIQNPHFALPDATPQALAAADASDWTTPKPPVELTVVDTTSTPYVRAGSPVLSPGMELIPLVVDTQTGVEVFQAKYAAGFTNPWHTHPCAHGIYVLDGTLTTHQGNHPAGSFVWFPEGGTMFHGAGPDADCTFLFVANKRLDIHFVDQHEPHRSQ